MMGDTQSKRLIIIKGLLFVVLGSGAAGMLLFQNWSWENAVLLGITIWAFALAYYFAFYVIENYVDSAYKFAFLLRRDQQYDEPRTKNTEIQTCRLDLQAADKQSPANAIHSRHPRRPASSSQALHFV